MCREAAWAEQAVKVTFAVRFSTQDVRIKIKATGVLETPVFFCYRDWMNLILNLFSKEQNGKRCSRPVRGLSGAAPEGRPEG